MSEPAILDLLAGNPLSPAEIEHAGQDLYAYNVEVTPAGCATVTVPILAADSVDAMNRAFEILYPNWDEDKPKSGMKIRVVSFERRK